MRGSRMKAEANLDHLALRQRERPPREGVDCLHAEALEDICRRAEGATLGIKLAGP